MTDFFWLSHDVIEKPEATFSRHALLLPHDVIEKPEATFSRHVPMQSPAVWKTPGLRFEFVAPHIADLCG